MEAGTATKASLTASLEALLAANDGFLAGIKPRNFGDSIEGFVTVEDADETQVTSLDVTLNDDTFFGFVSKSADTEITVSQGSKVKKIPVPSGTILAILTSRDGSRITNLRNGFYSTESTTVTVAPSTSFLLLSVDTTGLFYIEKVYLLTKVTSQVTVPEDMLMGPILHSVDLKITHIGGRDFRVQYISSETDGSSTFRPFGLVHTDSSQSETLVIRSSVDISNGQHVSAILPVGSADHGSETAQIALNDGDLFAIVPASGQGGVDVTFADQSESSYFIVAGSVFTVKMVAPAVMENIAGGYYTTDGTRLSFPAGCVLSVMKIGVDGSLIVGSSVESDSSFTMTVASQSLVGVLRRSATGILTAFGEAPLVIQKVVSGTSSSSVAHLAVLRLHFRSVLSQSPFFMIFFLFFTKFFCCY